MELTVQELNGVFIIINGKEAVSCCGCCGKRLDAKMTGVLMAKVFSGDISWEELYKTSKAWEAIGGDTAKT